MVLTQGQNIFGVEHHLSPPNPFGVDKAEEFIGDPESAGPVSNQVGFFHFLGSSCWAEGRKMAMNRAQEATGKELPLLQPLLRPAVGQAGRDVQVVAGGFDQALKLLPGYSPGPAEADLFPRHVFENQFFASRAVSLNHCVHRFLRVNFPKYTTGNELKANETTRILNTLFTPDCQKKHHSLQRSTRSRFWSIARWEDN